jgi:hypothetical protein
MTYPESRDWHLDRKFSFGLIFAMTVQIGAAVWFASKMDSRIETLDLRYLALAAETAKNRQFQIDQRIRVWDRVTAQGKSLNTFRTELASVDARLEYITRSLDRLLLLTDRRGEATKSR